MKKKIVCLIFGHHWSHWIWAEDRDYAVRRCKRCGKLSWGGTKEYVMTFSRELENPSIIKRI